MNLFISYLLKFFGSNCFVHNFGPDVDKLFARSHKCVFLGYTRSQKGYKCFSPSLNHYFISADVTFIESSFYFKSLSSPHVSPSTLVHIPIVFDTPVVSSVPKDSFIHHLFMFSIHLMTLFLCQLFRPFGSDN